MNSSLAALALAAALAIPASAARAQPTAGPAPDYVHAATAFDAFQIAEARLALARSHDPRILHAARMMIRDHRASTAQVDAAVRGLDGRDPPRARPTADERAMLAELRAARPRAFDRLYVDQQVRSHEAALAVQRDYARSGDQVALRSTARTLIPVVEQHLDVWRDLRLRVR